MAQRLELLDAFQLARVQAYRIGKRATRERAPTRTPTRTRTSHARRRARRRSSPRFPRCPRWNDSRIEPASTSPGCARSIPRISGGCRSTSSRRGRCLARRWTRRSWRGRPDARKSRSGDAPRRNAGNEIESSRGRDGSRRRTARRRRALHFRVCPSPGALALVSEPAPSRGNENRPTPARFFWSPKSDAELVFAVVRSLITRAPREYSLRGARVARREAPGGRAPVQRAFPETRQHGRARGSHRRDGGAVRRARRSRESSRGHRGRRRRERGESANRWDAEGVWCESVDAELKETVREMLKAHPPAYKGRRSRGAYDSESDSADRVPLGRLARAESDSDERGRGSPGEPRARFGFGRGRGRFGFRFGRGRGRFARREARETRRRASRRSRSPRFHGRTPGVARRVRQRARAGQDARHAPRGPPRRRRRETRASRDDGGCR